MVSQTQTLQMKQGQSLVMSQQMQQSLKILQLSTLDLAEHIETELEINPLLEVEENNKEFDSREENQERLEEKPSKDKDSFDNLTSSDFKTDSEPVENYNNSETEDRWNAADVNNSSGSYSGEDDAGTIIEKTYSEKISLKDHLLEQINLDFIDSKEKIIGAHLIDMVDGSGYLSSESLEQDLEQLAELLNCKQQDIMNVLKKLQSLDPVGVCSRNLKEYLKIQLEHKQSIDDAIITLIDNLELLAKGELGKLIKLCKVDAEDMSEMIKEIKNLDPRPASNFSEDEAQTKHNDLKLVKKKDGWNLELNQDTLPKIVVRKEYYIDIKKNKLNGDDKKYLSENYNSANFLVRAIQQRYETLLKVGAEIVRQQEGFFNNGINYLKPLIMKDIAKAVDMHESTIARVVNGKYIETATGVYELKFFFNSSLSGTLGDDEFSSATVKHQVKEIIEAEEKILSDEAIAKILNERGINVARRTVAKYRESMEIPTSAVRKRLKKLDV